MNFVFLVTHFPTLENPSSNLEKLTMIGIQQDRILRKKKVSPPIKEHILNDLSKFSQKPPKPDVANNGNCQPYGCPLYPPELTPQLNESLIRSFQHNQLEHFLEPFFTETFAMLTQQGKSHKENQDRGLFISPFVIHDNEVPTNDSLPSFLAAIFDGHNSLGHLVAQEVVEQLPNTLAENLRKSLHGAWWKDDYNSDALVAAAFNDTFLQVNKNGTPFNFLRGGTTASVALRYGSKLYMANAGDSQIVLVSVTKPNGTVNLEFMTRKDKPFEVDEMERIKKMGGKIHINPLHPKDARVVVHSTASRDTIALAMSRSLGDWEWKHVGVTAEPIVHSIDLNEPRYKNTQSLFLIVASDGMWNIRRDKFYANQFATAFDDNLIEHSAANSASGVHPPSDPKLRPAFKLHDVFQRITPRTKKGYCDDITSIII
ncbi:protein phosphatase 2C [Nitzschia inconspicua]|uniref:Protein phosphatase 2C n=1 Tax=Nitzschia inconspicua TaxID=303405 RepID=A0A9K3KF40_9STRA|nr:protein phosphatase 2C [Nitzschia inconspicua]